MAKAEAPRDIDEYIARFPTDIRGGESAMVDAADRVVIVPVAVTLEHGERFTWLLQDPAMFSPARDSDAPWSTPA